MDDDKKKKKRNKKKKNNKPADDAPAAANGQVSASAENRSDDAQISGNREVSKVTEDPQSNVNQNRHESNGTESSSLTESQKRHWQPDIDVIATVEETIKKLQKEKELQIQKEAILEGNIKQLQDEKDALIQKEATLEDTIKLLQTEKDAHMQKQAMLEDTIKLLRDENDSHMHKEAGLRTDIIQLQSEKDSLVQKEVGLEETISRLAGEKSIFDMKEASLQEKIKHLERDRDTLIAKEDSYKEIVATQNDVIARLQTQVLELEQSSNTLVQQNQQLLGNVSSLELQIKDLESVSTSQSSVELAKVKKFVEPDDSSAKVGVPSITTSATIVPVETTTSDTIVPVETTTSDTIVPVEAVGIINPISRSEEDTSSLGQKPDSLEVVPSKVETQSNGEMDSPLPESVHINGNVDIHHPASVSSLSLSHQSSESEIVQIPLDPNEVRDLEVPSAKNDNNEAALLTENDDKEAVSLTDAPLIGAPFRFVSFLARYVSGADLVNKS